MVAHGIELDTEAIRAFCCKWKIRELCVFGSILRDDFRPDSDVDFLVDYAEDAEWDLFDHFDMQDELARIVGRDVDIVDRGVIETSRNRLRKREILSTAEPVVATR
ncbi:MAG TPA: nucleotidyltransferase domain-containing protein [Chthonomonadaceae bacterium]|nr:nucleotidyltransferase domain-containing protein [Chthonomonadaceae bacterium]